MSHRGQPVQGASPRNLPLCGTLDTISESFGGTVDGEASALAKTFDLVWFDRFARSQFELHNIVAATEKDAGYSDGRRSVCRRGTQLLTTALMHVPAHQPRLTRRQGSPGKARISPHWRRWTVFGTGLPDTAR